MVAAIVLAAGQGSRFGSAKPLALYKGKPLVRHVVDALSAAEIDDIIVVVPQPEAPFQKALARTRAHLVVNAHAATGMSSSLRAGMNALGEHIDAVLVALGDQPTVDASVVDLIVHEWKRTRAHIVAPLYRGLRGHPVLFDAIVFAELRAVQGDRGARDVVDRDQERVCLLALDREMPPDVDTVADLAALRRKSRRHKRGGGAGGGA